MDCIETFVIKVEDVTADAMYDALEELLDKHGASYYTLLRGDVAVEVDADSHHLVYEALEAALYANARRMYDMLLEAGIAPPADVVAVVERLNAFKAKEGIG